MIPRPVLTLVLGLLAANVHGQHLGRALADASAVVIARAVGVTPLGDGVFLHRFETLRVLSGDVGARFTVAEQTLLAERPPLPPFAAPTLLCLRPLRDHALPARFIPYFEVDGRAGATAVADDSEAGRAIITLATHVLDHAHARTPAADTAATLATLAVTAPAPARDEVTALLREREDLREALPGAALDALAATALAETRDIAHRTALVSLAVEAGRADVLGTACRALASIDDPRHAAELGRLTAFVHGADSLDAWLPLLTDARGAHRERVLVAIGATRTARAGDWLIARARAEQPEPGLDAALRAHGSRRARAVADARRR